MRKPFSIASDAALRHVTLVLVAALLLGAGLSQIAGEPDGYPFIGVANAASSFDEARGAKLFSANCAVCHQASGEGIPGVFPPLKGDAVVLAPDPTGQIRVLLEGIQRANVGGTVYSSPMPPFGITVSDTQAGKVVDGQLRRSPHLMLASEPGNVRPDRGDRSSGVRPGLSEDAG